jgi:hypothetical protein
MLQIIRCLLAMTGVVVLGASAPEPTVDADASWRDRFVITDQPVFPPGLAARGVTQGSASFLLLVNRDGELADYLMLEASHLDVGKSVARALPEWKFRPTIIEGAAVNAISRITINLRSGGSVAMLSVSDDVQNVFPGRGKLVGEGQSAYRVAAMEDLDYLPELVHVVPPPSPAPGLIGAESVTVMFGLFIDPKGRVRIPVLQDAGGGLVDLSVLAATQEALLQWRFTPPVIEGQPVMVRTQQPFRFNGLSPTPSGDK